MGLIAHLQNSFNQYISAKLYSYQNVGWEKKIIISFMKIVFICETLEFSSPKYDLYKIMVKLA